MNPDRAVLGYARVFDTIVLGDGRIFGGGPESYAAFLRSGLGCDLRWEHGPLITDRGVIAYLGTWRRFALTEQPAGLLGLGEIAAGEVGDLLLDVLAEGLRSGPRWGLSLGAHAGEIDGYRDEQVWPFEVSVTSRPADRRALVAAVGRAAVDRWQALTGEEVPVGVAR